MFPMGYWPGGMGLAMVLITLIPLAAVLVGVLLLAHHWSVPTPGPAGPTEAEETLRLRYARGEIERPELDERLAALRTSVRRS